MITCLLTHLQIYSHPQNFLPLPQAYQQMKSLINYYSPSFHASLLNHFCPFFFSVISTLIQPLVVNKILIKLFYKGLEIKIIEIITKIIL